MTTEKALYIILQQPIRAKLYWWLLNLSFKNREATLLCFFATMGSLFRLFVHSGMYSFLSPLFFRLIFYLKKKKNLYEFLYKRSWFFHICINLWTQKSLLDRFHRLIININPIQLISIDTDLFYKGLIFFWFSFKDDKQEIKTINAKTKPLSWGFDSQHTIVKKADIYYFSFLPRSFKSSVSIRVFFFK